MKRFSSFEEFWPFYLGEHSRLTCRVLHFVGSSLGLVLLAAFFFTLNPLFILGGLVTGYAFAWIGHFFVEKNRPATFTYPLWSFMGDWKMWSLMVRGQLWTGTTQPVR